MHIGFFAECQSVEEVKILYRKLARLHHPDLGGDLEIMKILNNEYEQSLKSFDRSKKVGSDGIERTYYYNEKIELEIMAKIYAVFALKFDESKVDFYLIGTWLWIGSPKKEDFMGIKDEIKKLGFTWNSSRGMWTFHTGTWTGGKSKASLSEIANYYGATKLKDQDEKGKIKKKVIA